jgi:hypothetical protein
MVHDAIDSRHDLAATIKNGQFFFREFKVERLDWEMKIAPEDLAITIPRGYQIQGDDNWALLVAKQERIVSYNDLPQLWKELQASAEQWKKVAK